MPDTQHIGERGARAALVTIAEATSTNDVLMARARAGEATHGAALLALRQTAGRGRRGRAWESQEGNLFLSVLLRPPVDAARLGGLGAACGLGVLDGLSSLGCADGVRLKWPNDLVAHGRKLAGVLVEVAGATGGGDGAPLAACGVGVNVVAPTLAGADGALAPVGLSELVATPPELATLAEALRRGIVARADAWAHMLRDAPAATGPLAPLLDDYHARLAFLGSEVVVRSPAGDELARGRFEAVDAWGRAVVGGRALLPEQASLRPTP